MSLNKLVYFLEGSAKMAPVVSNKGNPSVPSGVTTPIQYGIMPGLMHYPVCCDCYVFVLL